MPSTVSFLFIIVTHSLPSHRSLPVLRQHLFNSRSISCLDIVLAQYEVLPRSRGSPQPSPSHKRNPHPVARRRSRAHRDSRRSNPIYQRPPKRSRRDREPGRPRHIRGRGRRRCRKLDQHSSPHSRSIHHVPLHTKLTPSLLEKRLLPWTLDQNRHLQLPAAQPVQQ